LIVNGAALLAAAPIKAMLTEKRREHGVSYGLAEAGYDIRIKQEVVLYPDARFALASALEEFDMPASLVGIVHDKSTWARRGLSVFNTVIEPGWKGFLTLELIYHGSTYLRIPAGAGIAQVLFHRTATVARYEGKYQNQPDRPVEARHD
jgi:dCTP deaminase